MEKYLYIFEDGEVKQSNNEPTEDDLECVMDGILQVIKVHAVFDGDDFVGVAVADIDAGGEFLEVPTFS